MHVCSRATTDALAWYIKLKSAPVDISIQHHQTSIAAGVGNPGGAGWLTARTVTASATPATSLTDWESTPKQGTKQTVLFIHLLKYWHKYHLSPLSFKQTSDNKVYC